MKVVQFFCFVLLLIISMELNAQTADSLEVRDYNWLVTYTPSALIGRYPTVQLGLEKKLRDKFYFEVEGGVMITDNITGYRARANVKYNFSKSVQLLLGVNYRKTEEVTLKWIAMDDFSFFQKIQRKFLLQRFSPSFGFAWNHHKQERIKVSISSSIGRGKCWGHEEVLRGGRYVLDKGPYNDGCTFLDFSVKLGYVIN